MCKCNDISNAADLCDRFFYPTKSKLFDNNLAHKDSYVNPLVTH